MSWLKIIKKVKSSDLEEITAAYEKALPFVIQDWAAWILRLPKSQRIHLIDKITRVHGEETGQKLKDEIFAQHELKRSRL
jgi:hypothetical protein